MLITCPYCGSRDVSEFTYQGDANRTRPDPSSTDQEAWNEYVYDRPNPAGPLREFWQHSGGCRSHLVAVRSTLTHAIASVRLARDPAGSPVSKRASKSGAAKKPRPSRRGKPGAAT